MEFVSSSVTWALGTYSPTGVDLPGVGPAPPVDSLFIENAVNNEPIGGWPSDHFSLQDGFHWGHLELGIGLDISVLVFPMTFSDDSVTGNEFPDLSAPGIAGYIQSFRFQDASSADRPVGWALLYEVTSARVRQVPEPDTLALLLAASGGLVLWRRRRAPAPRPAT